MCLQSDMAIGHHNLQWVSHCYARRGSLSHAIHHDVRWDVMGQWVTCRTSTTATSWPSVLLGQKRGVFTARTDRDQQLIVWCSSDLLGKLAHIDMPSTDSRAFCSLFLNEDLRNPRKYMNICICKRSLLINCIKLVKEIPIDNLHLMVRMQVIE